MFVILGIFIVIFGGAIASLNVAWWTSLFRQVGGWVVLGLLVAFVAIIFGVLRLAAMRAATQKSALSAFAAANGWEFRAAVPRTQLPLAAQSIIPDNDGEPPWVLYRPPLPMVLSGVHGDTEFQIIYATNLTQSLSPVQTWTTYLGVRGPDKEWSYTSHAGYRLDKAAMAQLLGTIK